MQIKLLLWHFASFSYKNKDTSTNPHSREPDLFSPRYINTIIEDIQLLPTRVDALKLWQADINQELRKPKDKRRAEKQMHEQFFTDMFENVLGLSEAQCWQ